MAHNQVMFTSEGFEKRMILNEILLNSILNDMTKQKEYFAFKW